ncbi:hypothetical protein LTS14_008869 [Recurvomyces mirabilis]|nr:hypothetical protein LTS14_008869 [Recurvomyces mirabilis]
MASRQRPEPYDDVGPSGPQTIRCTQARAIGTCGNVQMRDVESATTVERRPSQSSRSNNDAILVTEGFNGRRNTYREVTGRSSRRGSTRRSETYGGQSPAEYSSSSSPISYVERRPQAPSPPLHPSLMPTRRDSPLRSMGPDYGTPLRTVAADGSAVYDRVPSLELPRATENERHRSAQFRPQSTRRSSLSSTTVELDEPLTPSGRPQRPSISIVTEERSPRSSTSGTSASPGLSSLPKFSNLRRDVGLSNVRPRSDQSGSRDSRQSSYSEEERQARIERARLVETERRQQTRRDASRERHRAAAEARLLGQRDKSPAGIESDPLVDAEFAQMARERAEAEARAQQQDQAARYADDQLRRDADARARYVASTTGATEGRSGTYREDVRSPSATHPPPSQPVTVHHYPAASRRNSSFHEHGEAVIAREQMRDEGDRRDAHQGASRRTQHASRRLSYVLGDTAVEGPNVEYLDDREVEARLGRRASKKAQREGDRTERRRRFFGM